MKSRKYSFFIMGFGFLFFMGGLPYIPQDDAERWLHILTTYAMIILGIGIFVASLISLLNILKFIGKAALAKGSISEINRITLLGAGYHMFTICMFTVQFWTEQEESIEFQASTFRGNPNKVPKTIIVLYNLNNPHAAIINSFQELWLLPLMGMAMGVIFSAIFVYLWSFGGK